MKSKTKTAKLKAGKSSINLLNVAPEALPEQLEAFFGDKVVVITPDKVLYDITPMVEEPGTWSQKAKEWDIQSLSYCFSTDNEDPEGYAILGCENGKPRGLDMNPIGTLFYIQYHGMIKDLEVTKKNAAFLEEIIPHSFAEKGHYLCGNLIIGKNKMFENKMFQKRVIE